MSTFEDFGEKAKAYRKKFDSMPGEPIPASKVRPYNQVERTVLEAPTNTKTDRLEQILARICFDVDRYQLASEENPDMAPHFVRLISVSMIAGSEWVKHYQQEHDVDLATISSEFIGEESSSYTVIVEELVAAALSENAHCVSVDNYAQQG